MPKIDEYLQQERENRQRAIQRGDDQDGYLRNRTGYYNDAEDRYRDEGDLAYRDLSETPGYTNDESMGIRGNPGAGFGYYNPDELKRNVDENRVDLDRTVGDYGSGLKDAAGSVGGGVRKAAGDLGSGLKTAAGDYGKSLGDAAGRAKSTLSAPGDEELGYQGGVYNYLRGENEGGYGDLDKGLNGAIDPAKLGVSSQFASDYKLSPDQAENIRDVAGNTVRGQYQKMSDEAENRAAAQGNTSPAALAAIKDKLAREGAISAGDAMSSAELGINREAANRNQTLEGMRLGTEQDISSRETGAAGTRYGARTGAASNLASTEMAGLSSNTGHRLTAANTAAGLDYDAASTGGKYNYDAASTGGQAGIDAEKVAGDYGYRAADSGGQAGVNASQYSGQQKLNTNTGLQTTGQGLAVGADAAGSARSGKVADQRIAGQDKVRGYYTGQQGQAQQGSENATGQQIQNSGQQGSLANSATATGAQAQGQQNQIDKQPGEGERVGMGLVHAIFKNGGIVDRPTDALIGEAGPEMVIPLGKPRRYRMAA